MRKLKVWGGLTFAKGTQLRTIVATTTKKRAAEILRMSLYEFNNYWSETGNDIELETALKEPEIVFVASSSMGHDFIIDKDFGGD